MQISAEARVVASFTFVTALLVGAWQGLEYLAAGPPSFLPTDVGRLTAVLLPVAATAVALQAGRTTQERWAEVLAGATLVLGAVTTAGAVVWFLGNLASGY